VALQKAKRKKKKFAPPGLMLTSMMDMFTIILIFLLFSFSENPEQLKLDKDLELPRSSSEADYSEGVKLMLSKKELRLNDELIATVRGNEITGLDDEAMEESALYQQLKTYKAEAVKPEGETPTAPHVIFLCDQSHSFKTINRVIKTAGLAGYPNFQFAVLKGE
jgi:biopolymer transport protein ExbD